VSYINPEVFSHGTLVNIAGINNMKISKHLLGLLYQTVVEAQERWDDRPAKAKEDLMELEKIIFKELDKQRDY